MSSAHAQRAPAWQTEELQDEWPEDDQDEDDNNMSYGTQSVSLTVPLSSQIHTTTDFEPDPTPSSSKHRDVGTFLVREDVANVPLLPKTPGRNKKGLIKDFFTPLPLETMFEPPSPPNQLEQHLKVMERSPLAQPSVSRSDVERSGEMEDEIIETDMPNMNSFHGRKASMACQFTFSVPRDISSRPSGAGSGGTNAVPQAQSTPNPPFPPKTAPPTDPRLRLFQFQYDTYTREHLSALVDSIAVNTPSGTGTTATPTSFSNALSRVSEVTGTSANMSHLRSTKRLKLSPSSDLCTEGAGARATVTRPKIYGKDYVGESRSLMQQIKQARDFSTISSVASAQQNNSPSYEHIQNPSHEQYATHKTASTPVSTRRPTFLSIAEQTNDNAASSSSGTSGTSGTEVPKSNSYSSIAFRKKAEVLMGQIKSDMKRQKRVFSGDSELSHVTTQVEDNTITSYSGSLKLKADGKENHRHASSSTHRRTSSQKSNSSRARPSPKKSHKHLTEEDELVQSLSRTSIKDHPVVHITVMPQTTASSQPIYHESERSNHHLSNTPAPAFPSTSIRITTNEDLNRFVSSSTASGTTITAGSAPSFVKHAGPAHIRTIAPADLPPLPDRLGDMLFDKVMMRWVRNTAKATLDQERSGDQAEEVSDDPFGDIESLRDDSRPGEEEHHSRSGEDDDAHGGPTEMSVIEEQSEVEDEEEMELSNFSTDASAHIVHLMTGVDTDGYEDETTDSEDNDDLHTATRGEINDIDFDSEFEDSPSRVNIVDAHEAGPSPQRHHQHQRHQEAQQQQFLSVQVPANATAQISFSTPNRGNSGPSTATPIIKSALKSGSATPTSAIRSADRRRYQTPLQKHPAHVRSVSFSDGKREGPIQGITASGGTVQSRRSKRIADMMNALEDSDLDDEDDSPSKSSTTGRPEELQPLSARRPSTSMSTSSSKSQSQSPRRVFSRSYSQRAGRIDANGGANATFLTECSFGVAHDRLVQVITDVQPFEPHWDALTSIDLSDAKLESVARLKEFLPRLDALSLNSNELAWLSGIPTSVRTLSVAHNRLTGITSYAHLHNLENLDISHNEVESLRQLQCLRHLRELKADGNKIAALDGLEKLDGLVKLSVQGNRIREVDLREYRWTRLEMLNVSDNRVEGVRGLAGLQALIALNLDTNALPTLTLPPLPRLRILRASANRLAALDVSTLPGLRTLYADGNALRGRPVGVDGLRRLENLSLRNQRGGGMNLLTRDVRDARRLYLSGNPLGAEVLGEACYNMVYLELAACRLSALPAGLGGLLPNLRVLNLNYNFVEDVRPLAGLARLQKLTLIGSRLKSTKPLLRVLQGMPELEMLDFRMNPCTLGWYLPLLVKDVPGALQPSEGGRGGEVGGAQWAELDSKFRRDLPDAAYIGRLAYRGLIMRGCARLRMLDGVGVSEKERAKAQELLAGILGRR